MPTLPHSLPPSPLVKILSTLTSPKTFSPAPPPSLTSNTSTSSETISSDQFPTPSAASRNSRSSLSSTISSKAPSPVSRQQFHPKNAQPFLQPVSPGSDPGGARQFEEP
ncbi:hypothetical protein ACFX12_043683 [Malus domestica]